MYVLNNWQLDNVKRIIPKELLFYYDKPVVNDNDAPSFEAYIEKKYQGESQEDILMKLVFQEYYDSLKNDRDRKILDLFQKGYSHQKIAKEVNCPVGTVARVKKLCKNYILS